MATPNSSLYLGWDLSTQQLKGIVVTSSLKLVHEARADFDADFSAKYGVHKGVLTNPDENEIFAPPAMWLEAVDLVLSRLRHQGCDFSRIAGISGAGMQHGTVFWSGEAANLLAGLRKGKTLVEQLSGPTPGAEGYAFSHAFSPNWQDASTQAQCDAFDAQLGGPEELANVTGSKAHHRFSGPQILRFRRKFPRQYHRTARISLVSSFLASVFLGRVAPIDIGDVCGMNLRHIREGCWNEDLLELTAGSVDTSDLKEKLGGIPEDGGGSLGRVSPYFVDTYGFNADCQVVPFTGDNPATILALPLQATDAIVSLGTSTTFLMSTPEYKPDPSYHFMNHPTTAGLYMFMLCYKNGGLARERIRDALNLSSNASASSSSSAATPATPSMQDTSTKSKSWTTFNDTVLATPPLSQKSPDEPMKLGLYFPRPEIVPNLPACEHHYLYHPPGSSATATASPAKPKPYPAGAGASWSSPVDDARCILESQLLSLRLRSQNLVAPQRAPGRTATLPPQPRRIYLVGGGAVNPAIARLTGEVLGGAEGVYVLEIGPNACALGAAYKAVWALERREGESFEALVGARWDEAGFVRKVDVGYREGVWERYGEAAAGFARMEEDVLRRVGEEDVPRRVGEEADAEAMTEGSRAARGAHVMGSALSREREPGIGEES